MASGYPLTFPRLNLSLKEKKNQCNLLARGHIASADGGFISPLLSCVCSKTPSELKAFFSRCRLERGWLHTKLELQSAQTLNDIKVFWWCISFGLRLFGTDVRH